MPPPVQARFLVNLGDYVIDRIHAPQAVAVDMRRMHEYLEQLCISFCGMFLGTDRAARIRSAQDLGARFVPLTLVRFPLLSLFPSTVRIVVQSPHCYTHSHVGPVMYTTNHRAPQGLALRAQSTGQAQQQAVHTIPIVFKRLHYRLAGTAGAHQTIPGMHAPTHDLPRRAL